MEQAIGTIILVALVAVLSYFLGRSNQKGLENDKRLDDISRADDIILRASRDFANERIKPCTKTTC